MCDWSHWRWMCEGHYEIALTILLSIAGLIALAIVAILAIWKRRNTDARDKTLDSLRNALSRGEISADEFLSKCDQVDGKASISAKRAF